MKDKLERKIIIKFVGLRPKIYSYLAGNGCYDKKIKDIKNCVIKRETKFKNYKLSRRKLNKTEKKLNVDVEKLQKNTKNY